MENIEDIKLAKAKRRIEDLKGFYKHISAYILVNLFLMFVWKFSFTLFGNIKFTNRFEGGEFIGFPIWVFWGFFLVLHALKVFGFVRFFSKDWENKKIEEFLKKEQ